MKKRGRSLFVRGVAFCLCLSMLASVTAFAADGKFRRDTDRNYLKYINGFDDNTVRPDSILTRAQGAKMLYYVLELDGTGDQKTFSDVPESFWGYQAISALSSEGILNGYSGGVFKPNGGLTRAEFATIIARAMEIDTAGKTTDNFKDVKGHWAEGSIAALNQLAFIGGYGDGTFRPNAALTRAEAVKLINKAVGMEIDRSITSSAFSDLPVSHWAFYEIMSAASSSALEVAVDRNSVKFSDIKYMSLSETDFAAKRNELISEFNSAATSRKVELFSELIKFQLDINTAIAMANINIKRDITNAKYKADYAKISEAQNAITETYKALYEALEAAPDRDEVCAEIGIAFSDLVEPSEPMADELIALFKEESEYITEFNEFYNELSISYKGKRYSLPQAMSASEYELYDLGLDYYVESEVELGRIFDKLVDVRQRIAEYYAEDNYYELAYQYNEENIKAFREDVKKYLVPLYQNIYFARYDYDTGYEFPDTDFISDTSATIEDVQEALRDLSPQSRQALEHMIKYEMMDVEARDNKASGAFTAYLTQYDSSFLFMSREGGFFDVSTFSHEFGHVLQNFRRYGENPSNLPIDVAETASTSMELLMAKRFDEFFGENAEDAEQLILLNFIDQIIQCCMGDEFQTEIYKNPDMTAGQRNMLYRKIEEGYYGRYSVNAHPAYLKGLVWRAISHIYEVPLYMIEYALSSSVSLQIWEISKTDFDLAFETYIGLIESRYARFGLGPVAVGAGLNSPYADGTMATIAEMLGELFEADTEEKAA